MPLLLLLMLLPDAFIVELVVLLPLLLIPPLGWISPHTCCCEP